jgi:hypothetical protein
MNRDRTIIVLTALNALDGVLSFWTINVSGIAQEANPIMLALMRIHPFAFLLYKLLVIPVLLYWLVKEDWTIKLGMLFAAIYTVLVGMNLWIMFDAFVLGSF